MTLLGLCLAPGATVCGWLLVGLGGLHLVERLSLGRARFSPQGGEAAVQKVIDGELLAFEPF